MNHLHTTDGGPWTTDTFPLIFAHRGACTEAPENTPAAFRRAAALGVDGIELDVMCCATGELIVIHDYEVDRLSNGHGKVADLALDEIKALDFGSHFSPRFAGERAQTLPEVLEALSSNLLLNIEIKNGNLPSHGEEPKVAALIRRHNLYGRVLVSSFNPFVLRRLRKLDARIAIGWLYEARPPIYLRPRPVSTLLRPQALHPEFTVVSREMIESAHRRGFQVNVWTVNELSDIQRMVEWGVDSIITDHPERLLEIKRQK